jgi:hypothetical protein
MRTLNILLIVFALMITSCNTKEKKENTGKANENVVEKPALDEHGHPVGTHDHHHDHDSKNNKATVLDTGAPEAEKKDPNKKPDIVAYKDPLAAVSFTDNRLDAVYKYYIETKTALVNGDVKKAQEAASYLTMGYANLGVDEAIFKRVSDIVTAEDIETQRELLPGVTEDVAAMIKGKVKNGKIYRIFCPMAFNNSGGQWLSSDKTIENPYFGESMLSCGVVQGTVD